MAPTMMAPGGGRLAVGVELNWSGRNLGRVSTSSGPRKPKWRPPARSADGGAYVRRTSDRCPSMSSSPSEPAPATCRTSYSIGSRKRPIQCGSTPSGSRRISVSTAARRNRSVFAEIARPASASDDRSPAICPSTSIARSWSSGPPSANAHQSSAGTARVLDLRQRPLGLGPPRRLPQPGPPLAHQRTPLRVGLAPGVGLGALGRRLLGEHPVAAELLVAELLPGGVAAGLEPGDGHELGAGLGGQPRLLAPEAQLPVGLGGVGGLRTAGVVLGPGGGVGGRGDGARRRRGDRPRAGWSRPGRGRAWPRLPASVRG